jgi:hypothetical protein
MSKRLKGYGKRLGDIKLFEGRKRKGASSVRSARKGPRDSGGGWQSADGKIHEAKHRRSYGEPGSVHAGRAHRDVKVIEDAVKLAKRQVGNGDCGKALETILAGAGTLGSALRDADSGGVPANDLERVGHSLSDVADGFIQACMKGSGRGSSYVDYQKGFGKHRGQRVFVQAPPGFGGKRRR